MQPFAIRSRIVYQTASTCTQLKRSLFSIKRPVPARSQSSKSDQSFFFFFVNYIDFDDVHFSFFFNTTKCVERGVLILSHLGTCLLQNGSFFFLLWKLSFASRFRDSFYFLRFVHTCLNACLVAIRKASDADMYSTYSIYDPVCKIVDSSE